jgi:xanthine/CO dehydrogenase XdhC/CoxF family maturation factor
MRRRVAEREAGGMMTAGLLQAFDEWSAAGESLVLATVFETEGSTYSKAGAQMLITGDGRFHGMLSGGCLEGDLAERARNVLQTGVPRAVTYDLGQNDEELWGLGVGCDGLMRIFLQPLSPDRGYEPFGTMARALAGDTTQAAATIIESSLDEIRPGASLVTVDGELAWSDVEGEATEVLSGLIGRTLLGNRSSMEDIELAAGEVRALFTLLSPPPAILVLGAGLDAGPVVRFAAELGWRVTVQDHRPAYMESGDFRLAEKVLCVPVDELSQSLDLDRYSAAIVMSHHLVSDRSYLAQLAKSRASYIGLLGPIDRRRRLMEELGETARKLEGRLHGPAGLDIGGRGPASIALSIISEMHQVLMREAPA